MAKALIAAGLRVLRANGKAEAALGVSVDNPTGALALYQALGFEEREHFVFYQKPVTIDG